VAYAWSTPVYGTVSDESGAWLSNVTVKIYTQTGTLVATTSSGTNGSFVFENVETGTYSLHLNRVGYASVVQTIVIDTWEQELDTIALPAALKLSTSILTIKVMQGDPITIPFTVGNSGEDDEVVELLASSPDDWATRVLSGSYEVMKVSLSPSESLALQLKVTIPSIVLTNRDYNVSLTGVGTTNASLVFTVSVREGVKALKLTSSILSVVVVSGDKLQLPFAVSNTGEDSENVEFSVSSPENWYVRILDESNREIKNVSLSSGAASNFQLEVNVPLGSTGIHNLALIAVGKTTSRLGFAIQVESTNETVVSCQFPGKSATPGDTVKFQLELTNPFNVQVRFRLSVTSVPPNWTVSIKTTTGEYVTETILGANVAVSLVVEVQSPDSATTGETYSILFMAESDDQSATTSLPLNVVLTEVAQQVTIVAKLPEVAIKAGNVVDYSITVSNLGTVDRLLLLSAEPPSGWKTVFKVGSVEVTRLYIYAGNAEAIVVEVTPPSTVGLDTYTIPVQIRSESGTMLAKMDLKTTILGSYGLTLEMSTLLTSTEGGGSTSLTAKVTNTGYTSITGVVLDITLPEDAWTSTISPVQLTELSPKGSASFTVVIKTPENTVAGDYMVTLKGSSDQVSSDQVQVRVTASTSTSWGWYGVGIAIVFIVALVLVFRKFRRR
jgi:uncharacterized membrane protein